MSARRWVCLGLLASLLLGLGGTGVLADEAERLPVVDVWRSWVRLTGLVVSRPADDTVGVWVMGERSLRVTETTVFDESRGPSGFDVKHRFVLSYVWALPFGEGHRLASGGFLKPILENWQFGGIVTLSTGRPFTVFLNTGVNNGAASWPHRVGDGRLDDPTVDMWFDTSAFVAPPPNTYGDSGRGILYAPGTQTLDASLSRTFPIRTRFRLQFRADAFNLFNTPQFGFPNANIGSPTAGRITTTIADNRSLQFAVKLDW